MPFASSISKRSTSTASVASWAPLVECVALGNVMGGAIFTLADFAVAIASNIGEEPSACVVCSIQFMKGAKGDKLIATASTDRSGRTLGFYTIDVVDNLGTKVAKMTATCSRKPKA